MKELKMICPACGSEDAFFMGDLMLTAPVRYLFNLTKENLRSKEVRLWGFGWPTTNIYCRACGGMIGVEPFKPIQIYEVALSIIATMGGPQAKIAAAALADATKKAREKSCEAWE